MGSFYKQVSTVGHVSDSVTPKRVATKRVSDSSGKTIPALGSFEEYLNYFSRYSRIELLGIGMLITGEDGVSFFTGDVEGDIRSVSQAKAARSLASYFGDMALEAEYSGESEWIEDLSSVVIDSDTPSTSGDEWGSVAKLSDMVRDVVDTLRSSREDQHISYTVSGVDVGLEFTHPRDKDGNMVEVFVTFDGKPAGSVGRVDISGMYIAMRIMSEVLEMLDRHRFAG